MKQINSTTGICFFKVTDRMRLTKFLRTREFSPLDLASSEDLIHEWLDYGCIYVNGKRQREDLRLEPDQVVRLHTRRKSYGAAQETLENRIVADDAEFLVLDKPAGLPTHPTLDNFRDNAKFKLELELGIPMFTTHRLDVPTAGLLLFAKTPDAQRLFNKAFSLGRVEKIYRAISEAPAPLGRHIHFIDPSARVPRPIQEAEMPGWWRVELEILRSGLCPEGFWHEIKLLTGKTHQIRAQLSYLGAPILGDKTYGASAPLQASFERIALECFRLSFTFRSRTFAITRPQSLVAPQFYL